jgi:RNA:NAD 2'-phosphotransferase (TPT1/KptA family)
MDAKMIATSKWLAYVLRHGGAADLGLQKRPGGWLKLAELEATGRSSEIELLILLQSDKAGRFQAFCNRGEFWVRAVPGRGSRQEVIPANAVPPPPRHAPPPSAASSWSTPRGGGHATPQMPSLGPSSAVWRGEWVGQW